MSYTQSTEEEAILANTPPMGRFLDLGAYDPRVFSNTRALYERGWSGAMVEASPEPFTNLLKEYGHDPRIELIHAAVGIRSRFVKFHATADMLSTANEKFRDAWEAQRAYKGGFYGSFWCPQFTLEEILHVIPGTENQAQPFDFVSIDVEGESAALCLKMFEMRLTPGCVCVERDGMEIKIMALGERLGYKLAHETAENLILVRL